MKIIGIDDEKCIKCCDCVEACNSYLFNSPSTKVGDKKKVNFKDALDRCERCGHCISVCPTNAIIYEDAEKPLEFEEAKNPISIINYEDMVKVLRSRRSVRRFEQKSVPKEEIDAVLDAMRYAPSASNAQSWEYVVLTDLNKINELKTSVIEMMRLARKALKVGKLFKVFLPKNLKEEVSDPGVKCSLDNNIELYEKGVDPIFYGAPVVIITYAPEYGSMAGPDAGIALTYGMLAAQARGLGTCWIGFAQEALRRSKKNRKAYNIPKGMNVNGVLILGYPAIKYRRVPPREPLKVRWN